MQAIDDMKKKLREKKKVVSPKNKGKKEKLDGNVYMEKREIIYILQYDRNYIGEN